MWFIWLGRVGVGVEIFQFSDVEPAYRMVCMEDPFGNIPEIYSHSYELTYSAGAYRQDHEVPRVRSAAAAAAHQPRP